MYEFLSTAYTGYDLVLGFGVPGVKPAIIIHISSLGSFELIVT